MPNKGQSNNPNGRPKGSLNKTTAELRKMLMTAIEDKYEQFWTSWESLSEKDPGKAIDIFIDLCKIILPRIEAVRLADMEEQQPKANGFLANLVANSLIKVPAKGWFDK
jgi:hypothetical protein